MVAKKRQSKAKSKRGGRRVGSGRKTKAANELRAELIAESDKLICKNLPKLIENLLVLANGGFQRVEEKLEPESPSAAQILDPKYKPELVIVERKVSWAEPDRAANQYLIDRILGRPKQAVEHSGPNGGAIPLDFEQALTKVYGDAKTCDES